MCKMQKDSRSVIFRIAACLAIVAAIVGLDQWTKALAVSRLRPIYPRSYELWEGVFHFTYHENRGMAFGTCADNRWVFMLFSTISIVAIVLYLCKYFLQTDWLTTISLLFVLGGGIGNMIDRIFVGYVVDFLDFTLIDFAIFNVADSFVCVGAGLLCLAVILSECKRCKEEKQKEQENTNE